MKLSELGFQVFAVIAVFGVVVVGALVLFVAKELFQFSLKEFTYGLGK